MEKKDLRSAHKIVIVATITIVVISRAKIKTPRTST